MSTKTTMVMIGTFLAAVPAASGQVVRGVMTVTGAEMH
jgi:hypothetical protein